MKKQIIKLLLISLLIFCSKELNAFGTLNGNVNVACNSSGTYTVYFSSAFVPDNVQWTVYGAAITSYGYGKFSAVLQFPNSIGTASISVRNTITNETTSMTVYVGYPDITPYSQDINYGETATLSVIWPGGTAPSGSLQYQWQEFVGGTTYLPVSGATTYTYLPVMYASKTYRCVVTGIAGWGGYPFNTPNSTVTIRPLYAGYIALPQLPSFNTNPNVTTTPAYGGNCLQNSFQYEWEKSIAGGPWIVIGTSEASPVNTTPVDGAYNLRRKVICGTEVMYSNTLYVNHSGYTAVNWENKTYVREYTVVAKGYKSIEAVDQLPVGKKFVSTAFLDGFGRTVQKIDKEISVTSSGSWNDLVAHYEYDELGRVPKGFLPYSSPTSKGYFKTDATTAQTTYYQTQYSETHAYSRVDYENSPLSRVVKAYEPGTNLGGNNIGIISSYEFNKTGITDPVIPIWRIGYTTGSVPYSYFENYTDGSLFRSVVTDENGNKVIEYKDISGNIILKKVNKDPSYASTEWEGWANTFYVYDDFGKLRYIIPPKAVEILSENDWFLAGFSDIQNELCFWYEYDIRGRVIRKKSPGQAPVEMVYDAKDRLVYSQDGKQKNDNNKWLVSLYDNNERVVLTGIVATGLTRAELQSQVDANVVFNTESNPFTVIINGSQSHTLNINGNPLSSSSGLLVLSLTYYDNYNYPGAKTFSTAFTTDNTVPADEGEAVVKSELTTGAVTGTFVRVMDGTDKFLLSTVFYDDKGRAIQTHTENHRNTTDVLTVQYDFAGRERSSYTSHQSNLGFINIFNKSTLDKIGRTIKVSEKINNAAPKDLVEYVYNEMGQVKTKVLAPGFGGSQLERLEYEYNLRGLLTYMNKSYLTNPTGTDRYFGMELVYEKTTASITQGRPDGLLAGMSWKTKGDQIHRKYEFSYDNLGQLINASFKQKNTSGAAWTIDKADFSATTTYDANGNILSLIQKGIVPGTGVTTVDNLIYDYIFNGSYSTNKLLKVKENGTSTGNGKLGDFKDGSNGANGDDYVYNDDGQLIKDRNKEIGATGAGIEYNILGQPFKVTFDNLQKIITYTYDAAGNKLRKRVVQTANAANGNIGFDITTDYVADFIYNNNNLEFFSHIEGRVRIITASTANPLNYLTGGVVINGNTQAVYDYYIKDHLSNVRMILTEEQHQTYAKATAELANASAEEPIFGQPGAANELNLTRSNKPAGWNANTTQKVIKLSTTGTDKSVGPNVLMKVMSGDVIATNVNYYFQVSGGNNNITNHIVNTIIGNITGSSATSSIIKQSTAGIQNNFINPGPLKSFVEQSGAYASNPKAYLTVLFFDEQFNFVSSNSQKRQVEQSGDGIYSLPITGVEAPANGYCFIYLSNENETPVYFDDFQVTHTRGRIIEENHYYPYGLKIAGISAAAMPSGMGGAKQNSRVNYGYQGDYSEEDMDAQWSEFDLRTYDPQIGRFTSADPYDQFASPYLGMGNNPVVLIDPSGGSVVEGVLLGTVAGFVIGGGIGLIVDPENSEKYAYWGALLGGAGGYLLSTPNLPNFYVGPDWSLVKGEGLSTLTDIFNNAYLGSFIKSSLMEIFSLGKIVTIRGSNTVEINKQINDYFKSHPNASKIGNFVVEFHAGRYGSDRLSEKSFESIKENFTGNSTILMGNCFCGKSDYLDDISAMANGATVIGHYGYQNDLTFLLNGSLTGGNPNIMGSGHLSSDMFKHRIAAGGKIVKNEILATTHISNSGRITLKELQSRYVNRKLRVWDRVKSRFLWILEAIFNPSK